MFAGRAVRRDFAEGAVMRAVVGQNLVIADPLTLDIQRPGDRNISTKPVGH